MVVATNERIHSLSAAISGRWRFVKFLEDED
jgi:hypothetical protein